MAETEAELAVRLGERIRAERTKRWWSQAVLAERLDVSLDYVGMLERGERLPSFAVAIRIASLFDMPLAKLLTYPAPSPERPAEPWLDEAVAILRSLPPETLTIALGMLRAASAATVEKGSGVRKKRRRTRT